MAKVVIGAEVKVEGLEKADKSVGSFKKQLRDATAELVTMSEKFGLASTEAQNAAKKVAGLKDAIGDAKALSETFNPDKKFVALGGAIQGVTAGFSTYTGLMGVLGSKSEETEKLLLKVQSAMALQQGLSGIAGSIDSFKLMAATIKGSVVKAFSTLKGAIIATGIGALTVALGYVVANFDSVKKAVLNLIPGLGKVADFVGNIVTKFTDMIGVTSEADREAQKFAKNMSDRLDKEKFDLEANGDLYDEWTRRKKQANIDYLNSVKEIDLNEKVSAQERIDRAQKIIDLTMKRDRELARADEDRAKATKDYLEKEMQDRERAEEKRKALAEKEAERIKKYKEELKEFNDSFKKSKDQEIKDIEAFGEQLNETEKAKADAEIQRLKDNNEKMLQAKADLADLNLANDPDSIENKIAKIKADTDLELAALAEGDLKRQVLTQQASNQIVALKKDEADRLQALRQNALSTEITAYGAAASALSDVVGRQTAAGKALAIAEATINVFKAGLQVFSAPMPGIPPVSLGIKIATMVAAIATGIATVKKIVATKVPGGGGGGSAPSMPSLPGGPLIPRGTSTTLDPASINAIGSATNRSFVLEHDVSSNQERIRRLNRAARIN